MATKTVAVLGAGTGGLVAARRLRRLLGDDHRVVLVDRESTYAFAPSYLWVLTGARRPAQIQRDLRRLRRFGIELLTGDVLEIDTTRRLVKTSEADLAFDQLVIALGAELAPETLPGFADGVHNIYTLAGAEHAGQALANFSGGQVVVMVSRLPYKCPAAPYEVAFLVEAALRHRGVRDQTHIDVYTPEPFPMPTAGPELGHALEQMLAERGIGFHPEAPAERVDAEAGQIALADGTLVPADLLLGVPPHQAPEVARDSGLAAETGFLPVDRATLATAVEGVYAIGDVTTIPIAGGKFLPKAGVFAHAEAGVVAERIAAEAAGHAATASFDGKGGCFVELGDGRAASASGDFYAEGAPSVRLRHPGRRWHLAKVAFEKYWLRRWF
jgi:sulfide:quinone oxidoreductase